MLVTQVLVVVVLVVDGPAGHDDGGSHDPDEDHAAQDPPPGPSLDKGAFQDEEISVENNAHAQQSVTEVDKECIIDLIITNVFILSMYVLKSVNETLEPRICRRSEFWILWPLWRNTD